MTKEYFIVSDLHLGHENIIKYCNRPFKTVDEMNSTIIKNWNSVVEPHYTVYCLGDIVMNKRYLPLIDSLNGRKILVPGNHDIFEAKEYLKYFDDIRGYIVKEKIIFSHIPINKEINDRFIGNVHGHLHEKNVMLNNKQDLWYLNVSVEQINYTPVNLEEIIQIIKK